MGGMGGGQGWVGGSAGSQLQIAPSYFFQKKTAVVRGSSAVLWISADTFAGPFFSVRFSYRLAERVELRRLRLDRRRRPSPFFFLKKISEHADGERRGRRGRS